MSVNLTALVSGALLAAASAAQLQAAPAAVCSPANRAAPITLAEIETAQAQWGEGLVALGRIAQSGGDVTAAARRHVEQFYAYADGPVLFKPTLAAVDPFRTRFDEAVSYFAGGGSPEDTGFARNAWTHVRFRNEASVVDAGGALVMGEYWFGQRGGGEIRVEYTLGYARGGDCRPRIRLQHSSLPAPAPSQSAAPAS